jgi:hypothetical protein
VTELGGAHSNLLCTFVLLTPSPWVVPLRRTGISVRSRALPPMKAMSQRSGVFWALERPRRPDAPACRNQIIIRFDHPSLAGHEISNHLRAMEIGHRAVGLEVMQQAPPERKSFWLLVGRNDGLAFQGERTFGNSWERFPRNVPRVRRLPRGRPVVSDPRQMTVKASSSYYSDCVNRRIHQ